VSLSLAVGDRVVYPNQGLCNVTEIKTEEIAGQKLVFVSLVFVETGARVKVPEGKLEKNGVRRVSTQDDVKRVFTFLTSDSERASLDWKKRARDNTLKLSEGGLLGLAEVVKGLQVLSELRPLPPKEREQYNDARHLFVTELAVAMGGQEADAEDALDIVLFPVGKERPKRSVEEFKGLGEDDEFGLVDDLGLEAEPAEAEEPEEPAEGAEGDDEAGDEKPAKAADAPKKHGRPPKVKDEPAPKKAPLSDDEATVAHAVALEAPAPKKRGRPPKAKPEGVAAPPVEAPPEPKKRGRPPKAKAEPEPEPEAPKKRGRPPKKK
jgi:RNA polymerase-interacting CarD/CdnL/TRCF family regulator